MSICSPESKKWINKINVENASGIIFVCLMKERIYIQKNAQKNIIIFIIIIRITSVDSEIHEGCVSYCEHMNIDCCSYVFSINQLVNTYLMILYNFWGFAYSVKVELMKILILQKMYWTQEFMISTTLRHILPYSPTTCFFLDSL